MAFCVLFWICRYPFVSHYCHRLVYAQRLGFFLFFLSYHGYTALGLGLWIYIHSMVKHRSGVIDRYLQY